MAIRLDAVWQRVAGVVEHSEVEAIGARQRVDASGLQSIQVQTLRIYEGVEQTDGEIGVRFEHIVANDDQMIDRIVPAATKRSDPGPERIGDERPDVGTACIDVDGRGQLAGFEQRLDRLPGFDRNDVRRWLVRFDVLVARQNPSDLAEINAKLVR